MIRIGDLIENDVEQNQTGGRRTYPAVDNLAMKVFPLKMAQGIDYIHTKPLVKSEIPYLPDKKKYMGEYEAMVLGKLLAPQQPVICIEGPLGSGKTSTIHYLLGLIREADGANPEYEKIKRLVTIIDFLKLWPTSYDNSELDPASIRKNINDMNEKICHQLYARCAVYIDQSEEVTSFWDQMIYEYQIENDPTVDIVAAKIVQAYPAVYKTSEAHKATAEEIDRRTTLKNELCKGDVVWYLNYLILLLRYLLKTRFGGRLGNAIVVFDNLDGVSPDVQRTVLDFIRHAGHPEGPTFVIPLRPETRKWPGMAQIPVDVIEHIGPRVIDVINHYLTRFVEYPGSYFDPACGLTQTQFTVVHSFMKRLYYQTNNQDETLSKAVTWLSGRCIRIGLILAQHMFFVSHADMISEDTSVHHLIRAMVRQGLQQFTSSRVIPVENLFDIKSLSVNARFLLKPRILWHLLNNGNECQIRQLCTDFKCFGYEEDWIGEAVDNLTRCECQLLRSNGKDFFSHSSVGEKHSLYLTKKGRGYITGLAIEPDYLQEVMLDCRVEENIEGDDEDDKKWQYPLGYRRLTEKLDLLRRFLRELHEKDIVEVRHALENMGIGDYRRKYGNRLISVEVIQKSYPHIESILLSIAIRHEYIRYEAEKVQEDYVSLLHLAEEANFDILGVHPVPVIVHWVSDRQETSE